MFQVTNREGLLVSLSVYDVFIIATVVAVPHCGYIVDPNAEQTLEWYGRLGDRYSTVQQVYYAIDQGEYLGLF